eukprot:TRINITY_DN2202_c1_g1_i3.p1 TRINITY_DN2202_c1_g1~~TRINITY_DN2202_c1_g1_i3.p1  ORF type:complete len:649 (+),score=195.68 TRINITY_DN2202_c1_g1_i3:70-2016(+)
MSAGVEPRPQQAGAMSTGVEPQPQPAVAGAYGPTPSPPPSADIAPALALGRSSATPPPAPQPPPSAQGPSPGSLLLCPPLPGRLGSAQPRPRQLEEVLVHKLAIDARKYRRPLSGAPVSAGLGDAGLQELQRRHRRRPVTASADRGGQTRANLLESTERALAHKMGLHRHDNFHERVGLGHLGFDMESELSAALYTPAKHTGGGETPDDLSSAAGTDEPPVVRHIRRYAKSAQAVESRRRLARPLSGLAPTLRANEPYLEYLTHRRADQLHRAEEHLRGVGLPCGDASVDPVGVTEAEAAVFENFTAFISELRAKAEAEGRGEDLAGLQDEETLRGLFTRHMEQLYREAADPAAARPPQRPRAADGQRAAPPPPSLTRPLSASAKRAAGAGAFDPAQYLARLEDALGGGLPPSTGKVGAQHALLMKARAKLQHVLHMVARRERQYACAHRIVKQREAVDVLAQRLGLAAAAAAAAPAPAAAPGAPPDSAAEADGGAAPSQPAAAPPAQAAEAERLSAELEKGRRGLQELEATFAELMRPPPGASRRDLALPPRIQRERRALTVQQDAQSTLFQMMEAHTVGHFVALERQQVRHQSHSRLLFNKAPLRMRQRILAHRQRRMEEAPQDRSACLLFLPQPAHAPLNRIPVL